MIKSSLGYRGEGYSKEPPSSNHTNGSSKTLSEEGLHVGYQGTNDIRVQISTAGRLSIQEDGIIHNKLCRSHVADLLHSTEHRCRRV